MILDTTTTRKYNPVFVKPCTDTIRLDDVCTFVTLFVKNKTEIKRIIIVIF